MSLANATFIYIISGNDAKTEIENMRKKCKTSKSLQKNMSRLKTLLQERWPEAAALVDIEELEDEDDVCDVSVDFKVNQRFSYVNVMARVREYLANTPVCDMNIICDLMIVFMARPYEIYRLEFAGDSEMCSGYGRQGKRSIKYKGLVSVSDARVLVSLMKGFCRPSSPAFNKFTKDNYGMMPKQFYLVGMKYYQEEGKVSLSGDVGPRMKCTMPAAVAVDTEETESIKYNIDSESE